ncbi:ORF2 [Chinaberry tree badnavirus 1]|uniref:ORF2 n=1 Tax=Chinaberry tree badnavirus 1 TaxID=2908099 RepID=UPI002481B966|nr:ORF2 [Chinaberry tree badnavirus 1]UID85530.1 ORF2 [Chinaberry tree badnavirus 1]
MTKQPMYPKAVRAALRVKPQMLKHTAIGGITAIILLLNKIMCRYVQILLLALIAKKLDDESVRALTPKSKHVYQKNLSTSFHVFRFRKGSKGEQQDTKQREGKGTLIGDKDPYKILEEERAKLGLQQSQKDESKGKRTAAET